jgi:hypothetical protein
MLVLMDGEGDAGRHATDPGATGLSGGYLLDNGQVDEDADNDTIELELALTVVCDVVGGSGATHVSWHDDR